MKRVVLLNSGGLDSALKAKELYTATETIENPEEGGPTEQRAYEVYSVFIEVKGQLGLDQIRLAAEETASRYCDHHHTIYLDLGFSPNFYEDANGFFMYEDSVGVSDESFLITHTVFDPPARINLLTEQLEQVPIQSGPPNLSSVMLSLSVSYAKFIIAEEVHSGLHDLQTRDAAIKYYEAMNLNHAAVDRRWKPVIVTNDTYPTREEAKAALSDTEDEFDYVSESVPKTDFGVPLEA